jgi:hypothetical protein
MEFESDAFVSFTYINLSLCLTNYPLRHEGVWRSGCIHPCFLDLGTAGGRWSASLSDRFTPGGRSPRCALDRRLGGPQNRSGRIRERKILGPSRTRTPTLGRPIPIPTELFRLPTLNNIGIYCTHCFINRLTF